jgi:hypothetical protein
MSHFESPQFNRISLETVRLNLSNKREADIWVWGYSPEIDVISTDERIVTVVSTEARPGGYARVRIRALAESQAIMPKLQLRFQKLQVWDYCLVEVSNTALPAGYDAIHRYQTPKPAKVKINLYWDQGTTDNSIAYYMIVCDMLLRRHGLRLEVMPSKTSSPSNSVNYREEIYLSSQKAELLDLVGKIAVTDPGRLPVVICRFRAGANPIDAYGFTSDLPAELQPKLGKKYVFIDSNSRNPAGTTLLHEIGHAAGLGHMTGGAHVTDENLMNDSAVPPYTPTGPDMLINQVKAIAAAYFTE